MDKTKKQHFIPQVFLKQWNIQGKTNFNYYNKKAEIKKNRNKESVAYQYFMYSYKVQELFGASDQIKVNFMNENQLNNYVFYDQENNIIEDVIPYLCDKPAILRISKHGINLTKKETNLLYHTIDIWHNIEIEKDLSDIDNSWKSLAVEVNKFRDSYLLCQNDNMRNLIVKEFFHIKWDLIMKFIKLLYVRNPSYMYFIDEAHSFVKKAIPMVDEMSTSENDSKIKKVIFKNNIAEHLKNKISNIDSFGVEIILLSENQNIVLPFDCFIYIENKYCGLRLIQSGIYLPIAPKILACFYGKKIDTVKITTNLEDEYIDCLNKYFIEQSNEFIANFDIKTKYGLDL